MSARPVMSVSGDQLLKDGKPFRPRGFNMIGVLTPAWCKREPLGTEAHAHFGYPELHTAVHEWHANTVRFQISQFGLGDPSRTRGDIADYLQRIKDAVGW